MIDPSFAIDACAFIECPRSIASMRMRPHAAAHLRRTYAQSDAALKFSRKSEINCYIFAAGGQRQRPSHQRRSARSKATVENDPVRLPAGPNVPYLAGTNIFGKQLNVT